VSKVSFTELLRFQVLDKHGVNARLVDLIIHELDTDYPLVSHLVIHPDPRTELVIPWSSVQRIDRDAHRIKTGDLLQAGEEIPPQAVWLERDVLDALILDLQNRRVTRANDLWFTEHQGRLNLTAADTGFQAILGRLTGGRYRRSESHTVFDWKYVEFLRGDPQAVEAGAGYHRRITRLPPGEIAYLSTALPYLHAAELLQLLPEQLAADTLEVIPLERQLQIFEELDEQSALQILTHMAPDLAADLVGCIDTQLAHHYLNRLPRRHSEQIVDLLRYPENSVGGIMANDMVSLSPALKVGKARQILRELLKEPDFIYFIYAVDDDPPHRLRGVLSLRQILMADDDQKIADLMNPYLITLSPFDSPDEAGYRLLSSQLAALPVVGAEGQLLGTVTIDAAISQVAPRSWRAQAPRVFS
jgi:CBS domain-containing protein